MSRTSKIVLVVGIAAILLIVVMNTNRTKVVNSNTNSSGGGYLAGLFALGAGLGKSLSSSAPTTSDPYANAPGKVTDDSAFTTDEQRNAAGALGAIPGFGTVF